MKIVHLVLGKANPERMNGINRIVHELACAMHANKWDVEVWGITADPYSGTPPREYGLRLFPTASSRFKIAAELKTALSELHSGDCVHLHGALLPHFGAITRVLRQRNVDYVVTPHGAYSRAALARNSLAKRIYISLVDETVMRGARAVQVNSASEASELEERLPGLNIVVVSNGQRLHPTRADSDGKHLEFSFCGRLDSSHKGLDLLVDGFCEYRARGGIGTLALIGDGPDLEDLQERAAFVGHGVEFVGPLFGDEKLERLAQSSLFVHTSRHEGMPMAVLEAAALGLPLLLSRATNLADEVEAAEAGFIVAPNTPGSIARELFEVERQWAAGTLAERGLNAVAMIAGQFSWHDIVHRIAEEAYGQARSSMEAA